MIFCVLLSIDDFVRTFFLGGYRLTLPMLIFAKVQGGMSPEINAMATLVLVVTGGVGLYAEYYHPPCEDPLMEPVVQFRQCHQELRQARCRR